MNVIINADDLGGSDKINDAIFDLMSNQLISSSTIMANGPSVGAVAANANNYCNCSFGIHLNLTQFTPLSDPTDLLPILDTSGDFAGLEALLKVRMTQALARAIYREFQCQVEQLLSLEINISHIDSHQHIHTIPKMFPILKRVQAYFGINRVRITKNIYLNSEAVSHYLLLKKRIFNTLLRRYYRTRTTSGFVGLLEFYENAKSNNINHKTVEIMVHPGSADPTGELELLKPRWYEQLPMDFNLINYNDL